jgi:protein phosphatase
MTRLSHDHSYVQTLVDAGQITEEEARNHPNRNIITKAVGTENSVDGDVFVLDETCADKILICSDGLCGYVDDVKTEEIINNCRNCEEAVNALVDKANEAGGFDNITAVIMENANSSKNS